MPGKRNTRAYINLMCVHVHTCLYVGVHVCVHMCIVCVLCAHAHVYIYLCVSMCMHVCVDT